MEYIVIILLTSSLPLIFGWILDLIFADSTRIPHPIVGFGRIISVGEKLLNKGIYKRTKGGLFALSCIVLMFLVGGIALYVCKTNLILGFFIKAIMVFFCISGTTLIREVKQVFKALNDSLEKGRRQVARIVGRDTNELSEKEIRTAALETLSENLSDGVIAPLFWFALLDLPGLLAYKMINTLDSMIGYRTERYKQFGFVAAKIDDIANYIPARITAIIMIIVAGMKLNLLWFVIKYGKKHASPNSGYPEAALAGILNCRFGGGHFYFGEFFPKPHIGENDRQLTNNDLKTAIKINRRTEVLFLIITIIIHGFITYKIMI